MCESDAAIRFVTVGAVDDIPNGTSRMFVVEGKAVGVFHVEHQFYALDNACPHAGASLAHGHLDGCTVSCRIHHWRFCLKTGTYLDEPASRWNVQVVPVRVVEGHIQIGLPQSVD